MINKKILVGLALSSMLAACGGSGVSPASLPPTSPGTPATAPSITTQPLSRSIAVGQTATFTVAAAGTAPLTYQWSKNSTVIAGATSASYTTAAATTADDGSAFTVVVENAAGSITSSGATLTITASAATAPSITTQPVSQSAAVGQTATFTVSAGGTAPLTYQWRKNSTGIVGATAASYTTPATTSADNAALFSVVVSNSAGSTTSSTATLTVTQPVAAVPVITVQPLSRSVTAGQSAMFSVAATGSTPLSYQWRKNAIPIAGATSSSYTTAATVTGDTGSAFSVVVTNTAGSVTSTNAVLTVASAVVHTDVLTYKNDLARSGQNSTESTLTPANVTPAKFGLLHTLAVDGKVDAQPLYVSQVSVSGVLHNIVVAATENDSVYAYDSDAGTLLWHVSLFGSGEIVSDTHGCGQITPQIGITSTPVIDRSAGAHGTVFVVAMSKVSSNSVYHQRLHALDLATGAELSGGPAEITATYTAHNGTVSTFSPGQYEERAALLLLNGTLYTSWTSHCDIAPYGGWIIPFNEATLAPGAALNVAANSNSGPAIWMAGGGPGADAAGNLYLLTANGNFESSLDVNGFPTGQDYGNSFLKLTTSGGTLAVADYFAMYNEVAESGSDKDLGSGGEMLLPDMNYTAGGTTTVKHLVVGAGKDGNIYVVDRDSMGKFNSVNNSAIWQQLSGALPGGIWSTPAYFNGTVYYGDVSGTLKAFRITNAKLATTPQSQSATHFGYPGTAASVSAAGTANGIVWAHENTSGGPAVLHAYDATNLATELYNSNQAAANRDQFGAGNKYITPTVADGKVFVGTTNSVAVFGLLP